MKKIAFALGCTLALSACSLPEHVRDEVLQVEVTGQNVDEDLGELHVDIFVPELNQSWNVNLGDQCGQYPLPIGEKFMTRFDITAYKDKPSELYYSPYTDKVWNYLCS
jgi:hypothetical protein